jgi:hypothetical protein
MAIKRPELENQVDDPEAKTLFQAATTASVHPEMRRRAATLFQELWVGKKRGGNVIQELGKLVPEMQEKLAK